VVSLPKGFTGLCSSSVDGGDSYGTYFSPFGSAGLHSLHREKLCVTFLKANTYWVCAPHSGAQVDFPWVTCPECGRVWFWLFVYLLLVGEKKKDKKREKWPEGFFPPWEHTLFAVPLWDFPGCYMKLKAVWRVTPWIICAPNVLSLIILARNNQNYPSVAPNSQGGFWSHRAQEFWFHTLTVIMDPSTSI
jgi:hypothetical protein